jgi:hypothetical protein
MFRDPLLDETPALLRLRRLFFLVAGALAVGVIGKTLIDLITYYPYGVDLEIPLRATTRWLAGGEPYLSEAFDVIAGPDLPFLYPPLVLPLLAPLTLLPRLVVLPIWTAFCVGCGVLACRRLALPWWAIPVVLAWPPFAEALLGGNVQVPLFAAFVAILYRGGGVNFQPRPRDPAEKRRAPVVDGLLSTLIGAIKVSLAHTWLFVLRRRPQSALLGVVIVSAVAIATLPLVGFDRWTDWLGQAGRSGDPNWQAIGWPLSRAIGRAPGLIVTALTVAAIVFVPVDKAAPWIGLLTVIGAPSLHMFGLIFLVPAMLEIRREVTLVAALLIATYTEFGMILGASLVTVAFALSGFAPILASRRSAPVEI